MKFAALISGGKDSIYNIIESVSYGHELVCLGNLYSNNGEIDSFMFQTSGVEITEFQAQCFEVPLIRQLINGKSYSQEMNYDFNQDDEVEDLFNLLTKIKTQFPQIEAISCGAIFSNYQRIRVENVCQRLNLVCLAYLWKRDQTQLLDDMISYQLKAQINKICSMGLKQQHLGKDIMDLRDYFEKLKNDFGFNVCGEGGEYESVVFDCILFKKYEIKSIEDEIIVHMDNFIAPVSYIKYNKLILVEKNQSTLDFQKMLVELKKKNNNIIKAQKNDQILIDFTDLKIQNSFQNSSQLQCKNNSNYLITKNIRNTDINQIFLKLQEILKENELKFENIIYIKLYIDDMDNFQKINTIYKQFFISQPPVRICIQQSSELKMKVIVNKKQFKNLHVQSLSSWAPANIGPYSQCNQNELLQFYAGQIGLKPQLLQLDDNIMSQYKQIKQNFKLLFLEMGNTSNWKQYILDMNVYFANNTQNIYQIIFKILKQFKNTGITFIYCQQLPKNAQIEIEILATNKDNKIYQKIGENLEITQIIDNSICQYQQINGKIKIHDFKNELIQQIQQIKNKIQFQNESILNIEFYIPNGFDIRLQCVLQQYFGNSFILDKIYQQQQQVQWKIQEYK